MKLSHSPNSVSMNGLSLLNCQQLPDYIEEYKKNHDYYIPDIVVDSIAELYQAWRNIE